MQQKAVKGLKCKKAVKGTWPEGDATWPDDGERVMGKAVKSSDGTWPEGEGGERGVL